ncbi:MAG: PhoH family protein [Myxococcota bacterium]|nr:PhoH family protein [Myxococcota bacterium]
MFRDADKLRELSGELGRNFKVLGRGFGIKVTQRGEQVVLSGDDQEDLELAARALQELYDLIDGGLQIQPSLVQQSCRALSKDPDTRLASLFGEVIYAGRRNKPVFPRSLGQRTYFHAMRNHDVVFGIGPAGTGKTYLAMAMAVAELMAGNVSRIVLCRPAVEAGEKLGYLPGDLAEKVNPYLRPLYDALYDMVDFNRTERLIERRVIEVAPLAFMRGRTLSDAFVILDEAQNTTVEQMKMFLTRLGVGSKAVVTGDVTQIDLPSRQRSGLVHARGVLERLERIGFVDFDHTDVVRHSLVSEIIQAYAKDAGEGRG